MKIYIQVDHLGGLSGSAPGPLAASALPCVGLPLWLLETPSNRAAGFEAGGNGSCQAGTGTVPLSPHSLGQSRRNMSSDSGG